MDEIIQQTRAVKDLSSHVFARLEAMLEAPAWQGADACLRRRSLPGNSAYRVQSCERRW